MPWEGEANNLEAHGDNRGLQALVKEGCNPEPWWQHQLQVGGEAYGTGGPKGDDSGSFVERFFLPTGNKYSVLFIPCLISGYLIYDFNEHFSNENTNAYVLLS